jgi:hypothetical protein
VRQKAHVLCWNIATESTFIVLYDLYQSYKHPMFINTSTKITAFLPYKLRDDSSGSDFEYAGSSAFLQL